MPWWIIPERGGWTVLVALAGLAGASLRCSGQQPIAPSPAQPPAAAAPGARRLTLDEARQLALTNNPDLSLARLNVDEKRHATAAARKDYLPKVVGNVTYFHFDKELGSVATFQRGFLGLVPPGTSTIGVPIATQNSTFSTVMRAQPITKLIAVNAATQLARADENIARAKFDKGTKDLLSGVAQAYHGLLGAQRIHAALQLQARVVEQIAAAKPTPELRAGLIELKQGLLQVKGQVQELTDQLNSLLALPAGTTLELVDPLPPPPAVRSADEAAQTALASSPEVREAEQNIAKATAARQVARMDYLPDVNVIGGYGNNAATPTIQPNFGYLGVTASYTFFEWGKKGDVLRQRPAQIALAHQNLQVAREKVQLEARKAYGAYEQALEAYQLAEEMVRVRMEAEKGATTPATALEAKQATAKAELDRMKAEIAYRVAHAQLLAAVGC
jgi:outer membrane protein TolC